jgi:hypothetical protein
MFFLLYLKSFTYAMQHDSGSPRFLIAPSTIAITITIAQRSLVPATTTLLP